MAAAVLPPPLPVAIEQVKAYLRIQGSDEDALLAGLVRTASELCEALTRTALIEREVEETIAARPGWTRLEAAPVRAILAVSGLAADGSATLLAPDDFAIDIDSAGDGWVRVLRSAGAERAAVLYRAGRAADWNGVPEPLRHGIVRLAAHFYTHRDGEDGSAPPAAVTALWLPYRRLRLS
jgi:uncharacterized phiE125 gp8 family phage protein